MQRHAVADGARFVLLEVTPRDDLFVMHRFLVSKNRQVTGEIDTVDQLSHERQGQIADNGSVEKLAAQGKNLESQLIATIFGKTAEVATLLQNAEDGTCRALRNTEPTGEVRVCESGIAFGNCFENA